MLLREALTVTSERVDHAASLLDVPEDTGLTFVLGYHRVPADLPSAIFPYAKKSDLVFVEVLGWQESQIALMNEVSLSTPGSSRQVMERYGVRHGNAPKALKIARMIEGTGPL